MKLSCRNYERRRCWTRAGNIKRLAHNHMSLQSSNTVWKSCENDKHTLRGRSEPGGLFIAPCRTPEVSQLDFSVYLYHLAKSLLCCTQWWWWWCKNIWKKQNKNKNQSWTSGSFFFKVFFILFVSQKMKTDMATVLSLCSIRKTCKTRRTLEKAHKTEWLTTVCPQMAREHPFTWIYKYRQWQHIQEEAEALSHHNKVCLFKMLVIFIVSLTRLKKINPIRAQIKPIYQVNEWRLISYQPFKRTVMLQLVMLAWHKNLWETVWLWLGMLFWSSWINA